MKKDLSGKIIYVKKSEAIPNDKYCYIRVYSDKKVKIIDKHVNTDDTECNYVKICSNGQIELLDGKYSCRYDCYYCPNFPNLPRSYLPGEPSVDRAIRCNFEVFKMITDRAKQYIQQGHSIDKAEVIIQGGTWDTYSYEYRIEFIRDVYYTFNILMDYFFGRPIREPLGMEQEIKINESASCRIVGLTPETRPDQINYKTIHFLRKIGATRVQLGVQHLDDNILRHINRKCYTRDTIRAIQMLKDANFKIDCHLMPDLPHCEGYEGKMPEVDRQMFEEFNTNSAFKVDQIKIYPCVVTAHTEIKKWYDARTYKPYGELKKMTHAEKIAYRRLSAKKKMEMRLENPLYKNIFDFYQNIHPSIRVNRVFRDIPTNVICGGTTQSSFRSEMDMDLETLGLLSSCIRYREAGNTRNKSRTDIGNVIMKELKFEASGGIEYFLTWESDDAKPVLYSFLRLRLSKNAGLTDKGKVIFPELIGCAMIREVHTYGKVTPCKENQKHYENNTIMFSQEAEEKPQHKGLGKKLIARAEEIAIENGYEKMSVIAGVGVREYYRKLGYTTDSELGCYQIKKLSTLSSKKEIYMICKKYIDVLKTGVYFKLFCSILIVICSILLKYFFY
jgi:histone acetyltransferase (RNA polymerase elongator complex component)